MDENTTKYIDWFNQNMFQSPYLYSTPNVSSGKKTNWLGMATSLAPQLYSAGKGATEGMRGFNIASKGISGMVDDAGQLASALNGPSAIAGASQATKLGAAGAGAWKAIGGAAGLANIGLTAANFLPGAQADYTDTVEKGMNIAGTGVGILSAFGVAGLGPLGLALGGASLANRLLSKRAGEHKTDTTMLANTGSSYTGLGQDVSAAGKKATLLKKLFNKSYTAKNVNEKIKDIDTKRFLASDIAYRTGRDTLASINSMDDITRKNQQQLFGPLDTRMLAAKKGTKLSTLKNIKAKAKRNNELKKLKEGGTLNVIPSGALHARKHNLPEEIAEQVTNKGIPVVSEETGGKLVQHAEIEHSEIIFRKELTDKIEALYKKFEDGDESAAIEAGKLLTFEILENTEDKVGLLNTVQ